MRRGKQKTSIADGDAGAMKLGTSFHRTFALRRDTLRQVLLSSIQCDAAYRTLRKTTSLGTIQIESARRYGFGTGLWDDGGSVSALGVVVARHDPGMSLAGTQWLLHYGLCTPRGHGPEFWNRCVRRCLRPEQTLAVEDVQRTIARYLADEEGRSVAPDTIRSTATIFLGSYAKVDGLSALRLVEGPDGGQFRVAEPVPMPENVYAYAVCHYWESVLGGAVTVNLSDIGGGSELSSILLLSAGAANRMLRGLQGMGIVEVHRTAPPYQVVRCWRSAEDMLDRVYES